MGKQRNKGTITTTHRPFYVFFYGPLCCFVRWLIRSPCDRRTILCSYTMPGECGRLFLCTAEQIYTLHMLNGSKRSLSLLLDTLSKWINKSWMLTQGRWQRGWLSPAGNNTRPLFILRSPPPPPPSSPSGSRPGPSRGHKMLLEALLGVPPCVRHCHWKSCTKNNPTEK